MPRTLSGERPRTTIEANNWVERLMKSTSQWWTPEKAHSSTQTAHIPGAHASTQTAHTSILMSPSPAPTSRWNATGGSSTMMSGEVTTSQPSSPTTNHRVPRRLTQSSDSFVGQFRLSIQGFANKEGKPGTNSVLLYSLSRSLLDECFDGQGNLIDNPGTSVTAFDLLKSAAEQVSKRMKHIKMADRSEAGWSIVQFYGTDSLATDAGDEKRIKSSEKKALLNKTTTGGPTRVGRTTTGLYHTLLYWWAEFYTYILHTAYLAVSGSVICI